MVWSWCNEIFILSTVNVIFKPLLKKSFCFSYYKNRKTKQPVKGAYTAFDLIQNIYTQTKCGGQESAIVTECIKYVPSTRCLTCTDNRL